MAGRIGEEVEDRLRRRRSPSTDSWFLLLKTCSTWADRTSGREHVRYVGSCLRARTRNLPPTSPTPASSTVWTTWWSCSSAGAASITTIRVSQLDPRAAVCLARRAPRGRAAPRRGRAAATSATLIELDRTDGTIGDLAVDRGHEHVAARALAALFGPEVRMPIELHVEAKRFLCAIEPGYAATVRRLGAQPRDPRRRHDRRRGGQFACAARCERRSRRAPLGRRRQGRAARGAPLAHFVPLLRSLASWQAEGAGAR
ncbi:MAG: hypothetical protein R2713_16405 [Ilumatobacteraceae bacterium]